MTGSPRCSVNTADCVVVGGGPAGLTAACYLLRFHRSVVAFDDGDSRALRIPLSRNYPGVPDGIGGAELLRRLAEQFVSAGGRVVPARVSRVEGADGAFVVRADT